MPAIKKKHNHKTEEHFHDEWALTTPIEEINPIAFFEGPTTPEYHQCLKYLGNVKNKKILILGCGLGEEATYLALKGAQVTAIDLSSGMIDISSKVAKRYSVDKKITFKKMDAHQLLFKDNTFDAVFGCNILHHIDFVEALKETKRVLKLKGIGVFSEPLSYNPAINMYRVLAYRVRTDEEHPLSYSDIQKIKNIFPKTEHEEFHLCTLLIFVWFFVGEGLNPNKTRYWKKIIVESKKYEKAFNILYRIDKTTLKLIPALKKLCWVTVIKVTK